MTQSTTPKIPPAAVSAMLAARYPNQKHVAHTDECFKEAEAELAAALPHLIAEFRERLTSEDSFHEISRHHRFSEGHALLDALADAVFGAPDTSERVPEVGGER